jgi:hypothetical protein
MGDDARAAARTAGARRSRGASRSSYDAMNRPVAGRPANFSTGRFGAAEPIACNSRTPAVAAASTPTDHMPRQAPIADGVRKIATAPGADTQLVFLVKLSRQVFIQSMLIRAFSKFCASRKAWQRAQTARHHREPNRGARTTSLRHCGLYVMIPKRPAPAQAGFADLSEKIKRPSKSLRLRRAGRSRSIAWPPDTNLST